MVSKDWEHPRKEDGRFKPLFEDYEDSINYWNEDLKEYLKDNPNNDEDDYREYAGEKPNKNDFMPKFEGELYYMMYENTSEGTPLSPAFKTPQELAKYCAENFVSTFGNSSFATYEEWLEMIDRGSAPSGIMVNGQIMGGVEGLAKLKEFTKENNLESKK